jgi:hypothetical protein
MNRSIEMAKNTGRGHRIGAVRDRSQVHNPKTDTWTKRDTETGRFLDRKADSEPFKGVRRERNGKE